MSPRARPPHRLSAPTRAVFLAAALHACTSLERPQSLNDLPTDAARDDLPDDLPARDQPAPDAPLDAAPDALVDVAPDLDVTLFDAPDTRDGPDPFDAPDGRDAPDVVDVRDVTDVLDVVDVRDAADAADADVLDVRDAAADIPDIPDVPDVPDVPDASDIADVADVTDVADVITDIACAAGQTRCGAVCVSLNSDEANCGACGRACDAPNVVPRCALGTCRNVCLAGYANCDGDMTTGCEVRTDTDPLNCGACRNVCPSGRICTAGACVLQRSCPTPTTPGCGVVSLPTGGFTVGAPTNCDVMMPDPACGLEAAPPVNDVRVSAFQLDAYEVTVARFRVFWADRVRDNGASLRASPVPYPNGTSVAWLGVGREPTGPGSFNWSSMAGMREAHPMNGVDFWTAMEFCVWDGGRLPTEVEWEYAARGRGVTGRIYPWGDVPPPVMMCTERAHWALCSGEDGALTRRVGQFPSTAGGLYDLGGNVLEWTADTRSASRTLCWRGTVDPLCQEAASGTAERHIRGGSYFTVDTPSMRAASRATLNGSAQSSVVGFRCARSP